MSTYNPLNPNQEPESGEELPEDRKPAKELPEPFDEEQEEI